MRIRTSLLITISTLALTQKIFAIDADTKQKVWDIVSTGAYSHPIYSLIMYEASDAADSAQWYEKGSFGKVKLGEVNYVINDFSQRYQEAQKESKFLNNFSSDIKSAAAAVPYAGDYIQSKLDRFFFDKMLSDLEQAKNALIYDAMIEATISSGYDYDEFKNMSGRDLLDLSAQMQNSLSQVLDELDASDRIVFEQRADELISEVRNEALFNTITSENTSTKEQLSQHHKTVVEFFNITNKYIQENANQLLRLQDGQKHISQLVEETLESINQNGEKADRNLDQIALVQNILINNLDLKDQLALIESEYEIAGLPTITPEKQKTIKLAVAIESFQADVAKYASATYSLVTIAHNLGFGGESAGKALSMVSKAQTALTEGVNLYLNAYTGNVVGALSNVANLSGTFGGGTDPAAAAQQMILGMLNKIYKNQVIMINKLNSIDKKANLLLEGQQMIFEQLIETRKHLHNVHMDLVNEIDKIKLASEANLQLNLEQRMSKIKDCYNFQNVVFNREKHLDLKTIRSLLHYNQRVRKSYSNCIDGVTDIVHDDGKISKSFLFPVDFELDYYSAHKRFYEKLYFDLNIDQASIEELVALMNPSKNYKAMTGKLDSVSINWTDKTFPGKYSPEDNYRNLLSPDNLLHPESVIYLLDPLTQIMPLFDITDIPDYRIKTLAEIMDPANIHHTKSLSGKDFLKRALSIVNVCIAQQSILSGDLFLEKILELVEKSDKSDNEISILENILETSPLLKYNFTSYYFNKKIKSQMKYYFLINSELPELAKAFLPDLKNDIFKEDDTWYLAITDNLSIAFPSLNQRRSGFKQTGYMQALLELRERIINGIFYYDAVSVDLSLMENKKASLFLLQLLNGTGALNFRGLE